MFNTIFNASGETPASSFLIAFGVALVSGFVFAFLCSIKTKSQKSFLIATALLPMSVAMVMALVNGNIGVGVAIAGAFSLVRFRSAAGTAKEIAIIFISMTAGVAFGVGYLGYGVLFLLVCGALLVACEFLPVFEKKENNLEKNLTVTLPESLDYTNIFDEVFAKYLTSFHQEKVKTVNMGSMFKITYRIVLKDAKDEKKMLDEIRTLNGNLEVATSRVETEVQIQL